MRPLLHVHSLSDLLALLARHWGKMLAVFALFVTAAALYGIYGTKIYRSEARLLLRLGRENSSMDPTATAFRSVNVSQTRLSEINSELQLLDSHDLRERVAASVGAEQILGDAGEDDKDAAILYLERNARARLVDDSHVLVIEFEHRNPEVARVVVEAMIDVFQEKHLAAFDSPGAYEFLTEQLREIEKQVTGKEEQLAQLRMDLGAIAVADSERNLQTRLAAIESAHSSVASELAGRKAARAAVTSSSKVEAAVVPLRAQLQELQVEELRLLGKGYRPTSTSVTSLRKTIREVQSMLTKAKEEQLAILQQEEEGITKGLTARVETLKQHAAEIQTQLAGLGAKALSMTRLERELATLRDNQARYEQSREQARIENALGQQHMTNVSVVQPALLPRRPVRPNLILCIGAGIMLGLMGACGALLIAEFADDRIKATGELGAPRDGHITTSLPRASDATAGLLASVLRTGEGSHFIAQMGKRLRPVLDHLSMGAPPSLENPKAYAVTGTGMGVGSTTTAMLLAAAFARKHGGPVLLVDADFVTAGLSTALGHDRPGLTNLVAPEPGEESVVMWSLGQNGLHCAGIGTGSRVTAGAADPGRMVAVLRRMQRNYPIIIMDLSPIVDHASAISIAGMCDSTVVVAEAGVTKLARLAKACELVEATGSSVSSVILNKAAHSMQDTARLVG
ncbi:MAG: GumC family protein [Planctomycetota bacterium]